jgi:hypothetical protein
MHVMNDEYNINQPSKMTWMATLPIGPICRNTDVGLMMDILADNKKIMKTNSVHTEP